MAEYTNQQAVRAGTASAATAANWAGAVVSLALIVGVAVWGYKLLSRDVTGVPVVRAAEGPMRVAPDNPGGQPADHMGLAVNEVAAAGGTDALPDRVVLAPAAPDLTEEMDVDTAALSDPEEAVPQQTLRLGTAEAEAGDDPAARMAALAEALAGNEEPLSDLQPVAAIAPQSRIPAPEPEAIPEATAAPVAPSEPTAAARGIDAPGVRVSIRPQNRPVTLSTTPERVAAPVATGPRDIDPDAVPPGTRLVQLGAYETPEIARQEWDRIAARFDTFFGGKDRVVQKASSGGRTFYRLRAFGFTDLSDARRFCAALVAENTDCIPVVTR